MNKTILQKSLQFAFFFFISLMVFQMLGVGQKKNQLEDISFKAKTKYSLGSEVQITVINNTDQDFSLPNDCQKTPLITERYQNGNWQIVSTQRSKVDLSNCKNPLNLEKSGKKIFTYSAQEVNQLFPEIGKYRVSVKIQDKNFSQEFEMVKPGFLKLIWIKAIYRPIYNLLVWLVKVMPQHSLALAIIALTIIVRIALLWPNYKAFLNQKAMQKIQPELEKLKEKYKDEKEKLAQETMQIWKKHKVSPSGSCLPVLMQFPFLIALFYVLKVGINNNSHLLYSMMADFDFQKINPHFFGLNLDHAGTWYLAIIIGALQFWQMKVSLPAQSKTEEKKDDPMKHANLMMKYFLPVMIGGFVLSAPIGLAIYWGISTFLTVGQQKGFEWIYQKNKM
ncbi:MAG TPA: YidC/Oxa1 family membrane protein insertase [Candidatus Gracilibacteria bacterium]|nr:YidC/Oxa1 family membrane protein insertase [Candidatus Gracilibacteria bacterium]